MGQNSPGISQDSPGTDLGTNETWLPAGTLFWALSRGPDTLEGAPGDLCPRWDTILTLLYGPDTLSDTPEDLASVWDTILDTFPWPRHSGGHSWTLLFGPRHFFDTFFLAPTLF